MRDYVFVCYAREDQDFVLQLAEALKKRSVSIWLDQWDIPAGADWDQSIDNAIYECAQFLIVLSAAAVGSREVGGELQTAIAKDRPIVPVLYRDCEIPRILRTTEYVDFKYRRPEDKACLERIAQALRTQSSQGQSPNDGWRNTLPSPVSNFVGRTWLFDQVQHFIDTHKSGYLVVIGDMGVGKSAFMSHLIRKAAREEHPVFHIIKYHPSATASPFEIVSQLYSQLQAKYRFGEPKEWNDLVNEKKDSREEREATRLELLLEHLSKNILKSDKSDKKEVLYIDAADQADVSKTKPLIPRLLRDLPDRIFCIITSRPDLDWLQDHRPQLLYMRDEEGQKEDCKDIGEFLQNSELFEKDSPFVEQIISSKHPPTFFTVVKCLEKLRSQKTSEPDKEALRTDPQYWVEPPVALLRKEASDLESRAEPRGISEREIWETLGILASAKEDLSRNHLVGFNIWTEETTELILRLAANFFQPHEPTPAQLLALAHPGYHRYILDNLALDQRAACHRRLAQGCLHWKDFSHDLERYALRYLPAHLIEASQWYKFKKDQWSKLEEVLSDIDFITKSFEKGATPNLVDAIRSVAQENQLSDNIVNALLTAFNAWVLSEVRKVETFSEQLRRELNRAFGRYADWPESLKDGLQKSDSFPVMLLLGEAYDGDGKHTKAAGILRRLVERMREQAVAEGQDSFKDPVFAELYAVAPVRYAAILDHLKRYDEGLEILNELLSPDEAQQIYGQNYWWAKYHQGILLRRLSKFDEAEAIFKEIREATGEARAEHVTAALHHLGIIDLERGKGLQKQGHAEDASKKFDEAEQKFKTCLKERPNEMGNHRRAYEFRRLGELYALARPGSEDAKEAFDEALEISKYCGHTRYIQEIRKAMASNTSTI